MKKLLRTQSGMSLLNVIMLLMLVGVVTTAGVKMMGPLVQRGKINDTKTTINSAVDAIISWSVANGRLPRFDATTGVDEITAILPNPNDAWGKPLVYAYDGNLAATATGGLCGRTTATYNGVAFVIISGGDDYRTDSTPATSKAFSAAPDLKTTDLSRAITLDELKAKAGCFGQTGGRLRIVNNELPSACSGASYSATLYGDGGVPAYTWATTTAGWIIDANGKLSRNSAPTINETVSVTLTDSKGTTVQRTYNLKVVPCGPADPAKLFREFVRDGNVFVYGTQFLFSGNTVNGPGSTAVITGASPDSNFNGGASVAVSTIYIDGPVKLSGSQILGSSTNPGKVYINGNLELVGGAQVYGTEIYVNGTVTTGSGTIGLSNKSSKIYINNDLNFPNGRLNGEVYVGRDLIMSNGTLDGNIHVYRNVSLDWTPKPQTNSYVYYNGTLTKPPSYTQHNDRYKKTPPVQPVVLPDMTLGYALPPLRTPLSWYTEHGYSTTTNEFTTGGSKKIFKSGDFVSGCGGWQMNYTVNDVIVVSSGNITISAGSCKLTGVLFAPNGKVTFGGSSFEGLVIAKDGFYVTSGGTTVTFKNISNYIPNIDDYPF